MMILVLMKLQHPEHGHAAPSRSCLFDNFETYYTDYRVNMAEATSRFFFSIFAVCKE